MEEDINRIKYILEFSKKTGIQYVLETDDEKRLNNILNELDRLQKENKAIKDENVYLDSALKEAKSIIAEKNIDLNDSVPKSVIQDKIKKYENEIAKCHFASDCMIIEEYEIKIDVLKELLEE